MQTNTHFSSEKLILSVLVGGFMTFGEQLYKWRKGKGLTQQELGRQVGVNVSYISNLERNFSATTKSGKPRPSADLCDKFAKVLGVPENEVRLAAGYAARFTQDMIKIELPDDVQVLLPNARDITSQEDLERFEIAFRVAYETVKERIRKSQD